MRLSTVVFGVTLLAGSAALAETWTIDDSHAGAKFSIKHMMVSNVEGTISGIKGKFEVDDKEPGKFSVEAVADANTINTNNAKRDGHLKSPDFFDTKKFPTITFKSKSVTKDGEKYKIVGDLTLHGVTKEVTLDSDGLTPAIKDLGGVMRRGFSATTKINRKDFGVSWNKALDSGGVALGEDVAVQIDAEATPASAAAPKKADKKADKKS